MFIEQVQQVEDKFEMIGSLVNLYFFGLFFAMSLLLLLSLKTKSRYLIALSIFFLVSSIVFDMLVMFGVDLLFSGFIFTIDFWLYFCIHAIVTLLFLIPAVLGLLFFENQELRKGFKQRVRWMPGFLADLISLGIAYYILGSLIIFLYLITGQPFIIIGQLITGQLLFRFSFLAIFSCGIVSGQSFFDADRSKKKGVIESILILGSLVLTLLAIFGISVKWNALYSHVPGLGILYFGGFFILQIPIYIIIVSDMEKKLIPGALLCHIAVILILIDNFDTIAGYPTELSLYLGILFPLGLLIGMYFAREM